MTPATDSIVSAGLEVGEAGLELSRPEPAPAGRPLIGGVHALLQIVNRAVMVPCMLAVVAAAACLTYSVAARYFLKVPTEWQDETAVFLLIGATFCSGAFVQSYRGHIGVEAIAELLPPRANRWRLLVIDLVSAAFCTFFAWKSWTLFLEALHEGHTSNSTWGPPLWIPYLLMACGTSLLAVQLALECAVRAVDTEVRP